MQASVVVPVYNDERYVGRCLESLLHQSYDNYEIIVVDDGSTDNSLNICRAKKSDRVQIFTKSNGGLSSARNFGIKKCSLKSDYILFADSDDTVSPDYISHMLEYANNNSLVICGIRHHTSQSFTAVDPTCVDFEQNNKHLRVKDIWNNEDFLRKLPSGIINSACNKCYSLETIRKNRLMFNDMFPEDTMFNINYLEYCRNVTFLDENLYNYIHRDGSMSKSPHISIYEGYIEIQKRLYNKVPLQLHSHIDEFVYPQYLANTKMFIRKNEYAIPQKYLKDPLVKRAIASHKAICMGDFLIKKLFQYRLLRLLNVSSTKIVKR